MPKPNFELVGNDTAPGLQMNGPTGGQPSSPTPNPTPKEAKGSENWPLDPLQALQRQVRMAMALGLVALLLAGGASAFLFKMVSRVGLTVDAKVKEGVRRGLEADRKNMQSQIQDALSASEKTTAEAIEGTKRELVAAHQADIQAIMTRLDEMQKARTLASTSKPHGKAKPKKKHR